MSRWYAGADGYWDDPVKTRLYPVSGTRSLDTWTKAWTNEQAFAYIYSFKRLMIKHCDHHTGSGMRFATKYSPFQSSMYNVSYFPHQTS